MKKIFCTVIAVSLMLTLAACGGKKQQTASLDTAAMYESFQQYLP